MARNSLVRDFLYSNDVSHFSDPARSTCVSQELMRSHRGNQVLKWEHTKFNLAFLMMREPPSCSISTSTVIWSERSCVGDDKGKRPGRCDSLVGWHETGS